MSPSITQQTVSAALLRSVLSGPRLESYRLTAADTAQALMGRYQWNVALCGALYPTFHYLEVTFRNRLHDALTARWGTVSWYTTSLAWLHPREQQKVADVEKELQRRGGPVTPDAMVAELRFGFWTSLLSRYYAQALWQDRTVIRQVFPGLPNRLRYRGFVNERLQQVRHFRNRVFHHEPIWNSPGLVQMHHALRQTLGWFEPEERLLLLVPDIFEKVYAQGPEAYEMEVR